MSVERLANGHYLLKVHIADVAHYVHEGSALDRGGAERGTSVYFPERAVHMFPEELATGLCSLRPHVDRLVQSCVMEIDGKGRVVDATMHDGVIVSRSRMTYTEVHAILAGDAAQREAYRELVPHFERMGELFEILNQRRHRRGSIDFDLPEAKIVLDAEGQIENILVAERNIAHRLIEEFMLVANETVAAFLEANDVPTLYRIHEAPDLLKVEQFEEFITHARVHAGGADERREAAPLPEAGGEAARQARGTADCHADAADDAEGALRHGVPRPLRPGRRRATRTSPHRSAAIRT